MLRGRWWKHILIVAFQMLFDRDVERYGTYAGRGVLGIMFGVEIVGQVAGSVLYCSNLNNLKVSRVERNQEQYLFCVGITLLDGHRILMSDQNLLDKEQRLGSKW